MGWFCVWPPRLQGGQEGENLPSRVCAGSGWGTISGSAGRAGTPPRPSAFTLHLNPAHHLPSILMWALGNLSQAVSPSPHVGPSGFSLVPSVYVY